MLRKQDEWQQRIKSVEREFKCARLATDRLLDDYARDTSVLPPEIKLRDLHLASNHLEGTYVIRLFAEFEAALRLFWEGRKRTTPMAEQLLNAIAAQRHISSKLLNAAHRVREYRNSLIHRAVGQLVPMSVAEARQHLCHFLSFLPPTW